MLYTAVLISFNYSINLFSLKIKILLRKSFWGPKIILIILHYSCNVI